ncbi:MAG: DNA gyrase/topoisomerase IV subunit A [Streptomycetales bacterium]
MARRSTKDSTRNLPPDDLEERILDIDVADEMQGSFLQYAYSVIYSRALPDARDGLKPVHRRILYQMNQMGLRPDRGHVKSARVVGEVMGRLHPHGDGAIYDALVRMAQPFAMRVRLVDGHGNFGSLGGDDPPAAMRYTECRLAPSALLMTTSIDEEVVDFAPNYDGREQEPQVLPAAFPNLLVNGASGIAVGMATNMPPHNLGEVIEAARYLIRHPRATLDDLMAYLPGPDLPTGGSIVGLDGIRQAYERGRGTFRTRATVRIEDVRARRKGIVVTALPYMVGPEKVIAKIKELVQGKRLQGIADVRDLTDREKGLRLVVEVKNGFNPEAILELLYKLTPMEESFGINNVALVDGQPLTLGLRELLEVYVDHRFTVTRRRCEYRKRKAEERAHIVEGLLIALDAIDEVVRVIRSSADTAEARERLVAGFDLTEVQAQHILDMPLRRLTGLEVTRLRDELVVLRSTIAELTAILDSDELLRTLVSEELAQVAHDYATPRRTLLLETAWQPAAAVPLEIGDDPCWVLLSATGLLARTGNAGPLPPGQRTNHDVLGCAVRTTTRGTVAAVTTRGRLVRLDVLDLPALPATAYTPSLAGGVPVSELVDLAGGERVLALATVSDEGPGVALGTAQGVIKRVVPDHPANKNEWQVIPLREGDEVVGAAQLLSGDEDLCLITSDAQLLRFPAGTVRPQGRSAAGVSGIRLGPGARVVSFTALDRTGEAVVVTVAGSESMLPATPRSVKVSRYEDFPAKGRATGGVRCHRFLKGEDRLVLAWAGPAPARGTAAGGAAIDLPDAEGRRDGSGTPLDRPLAAVGGPLALR